MNSAPDQNQCLDGSGYIRPGKVIEVNTETGKVFLMFTGQGSSTTKTWATPALPFDYQLKWGQTVLAADGGADGVYVIGILNDSPMVDAPAFSHALKSGARAQIESDNETLKLFSKEGSLVFQYEDATGKTSLNMPSGDLEINTPQGGINFVAAKGIRFLSNRPIELNSLQGIKFAVSDLLKNSLSFFNLGPKEITAGTDTVNLSARFGKMDMDKGLFKGRHLDAQVQDIRLEADRVETHARDIIQTASNFYKTIENIAQITTRRLRTLISETYQMKSKKIFIKAEDDVKIKGEKIHLG